MRTIASISLVLVVLIFVGCKPSNSHQQKGSKDLTGTIRLSGAFALYPLVELWADEFRKQNPEVKFEISTGGAGRGISDVLSGKVDLGMVSRDLTPDEIAHGVWFISLAKDAVLPTINASNPILSELKKKGVSKELLKKMFVTGEIKTWEELIGRPGKSSIHLFTRSDACGAASIWGAFLGCSQSDLMGDTCLGDPGIIVALKGDANSLGYNNVNYVFDNKTRQKFPGIDILPIDFNGNGILDGNEDIYRNLDVFNEAIMKGLYPSPPVRDLYFVSMGKPQKREVLAFIEWIMDEGQKYVSLAGYVPLSKSKIGNEKTKIVH